ncbi:docking protein 3 [Danio aesculapii]|uniref:docking protein 3 n=1 Tax=Danio aesculapii TaxID=1142201 RepID=UPI0024BFAD79|nr:docking protein 3 [Danio aesculapii]
MDVISKEGPLFLQGVKFGKKIWRKSWLVLLEAGPAGVGRLELWDLRDGGGRMGFGISKPAGFKRTDKRVIRLSDCLSITPAPAESCPTDCSAFFLNTISCTFTIAAPQQDDWLAVLCRLAFQKSQSSEDSRRVQKDKYLPLASNELYSTWGTGQFQVCVQSTESSQRLRLSGSYLLSADKETVSLLDLKTGQPIQRWPYRLLRRFGPVKGGIMIEAGRRCPSGEGQFIFQSKQGSQIQRAIEDAIMHQSVQELLAQASAIPPQPQTRPEISKPPAVTVNPQRPAIHCKRGQQIHKAIEEALALPSYTPRPPSSPKPKTQLKEVKREKPCPPVPQINKYHNIQKLTPPPPPPPPPLPKNRPQDWTNALKNTENPRRNISLPDLPACIRSPVNSSDDVLYSVIFPQAKPRENINLPAPPAMQTHEDILSSEGCFTKKEETLYTNLSSIERSIEDLYSTVNYAAKRKNRQTEENSEILADFKQTLSSLLSKELGKVPPVFPGRSCGGSCDELDRVDELMTD